MNGEQKSRTKVVPKAPAMSRIQPPKAATVTKPPDAGASRKTKVLSFSSSQSVHSSANNAMSPNFAKPTNASNCHSRLQSADTNSACPKNDQFWRSKHPPVSSAIRKRTTPTPSEAGRDTVAEPLRKDVVEPSPPDDFQREPVFRVAFSPQSRKFTSSVCHSLLIIVAVLLFGFLSWLLIGEILDHFLRNSDIKIDHLQMSIFALLAVLSVPLSVLGITMVYIWWPTPSPIDIQHILDNADSIREDLNRISGVVTVAGKWTVTTRTIADRLRLYVSQAGYAANEENVDEIWNDLKDHGKRSEDLLTDIRCDEAFERLLHYFPTLNALSHVQQAGKLSDLFDIMQSYREIFPQVDKNSTPTHAAVIAKMAEDVSTIIADTSTIISTFGSPEYVQKLSKEIDDKCSRMPIAVTSETEEVMKHQSRSKIKKEST